MIRYVRFAWLASIVLLGLLSELAFGRRGRTAQYPVDHLRRHGARTGLLRRHVRQDAESGRIGQTQLALPDRLVERAGVRSGPHHDHLGRVSDQHGRRAHAERSPHAGVHEDVSAIPPRTRLLLHEQQQRGLQPDPARPGVGRFVGQGPLEEPAGRAAVFRDLQSDDQPRKPDPHAAPHAGARSGASAAAGVSPRHAGSPPRLGSILRQSDGHGRPGRPAACGTCRGRAGRGHDHLFLRRSWIGDAPQQTLAVRLRAARAVDRPRSGQVPRLGAAGLPAGRHDGSPGSVRRSGADAAQSDRRQAAGVDAGARLHGTATRPLRSNTCSAFAGGWTSVTTWSVRCATSVTSTSATTCRT